MKNEKRLPTCYKLKRAESEIIKRKLITKITVQFENEVGNIARQNL